MADFDDPKCTHAEYHGFREGYVSTVYFWCPKVKEHGCMLAKGKECKHYEEGTPKKFDKRGNELGGNND